MAAEALPECAQLAATTSFYIGLSYFLIGNWKEACENFATFFKETTTNENKSYATLCHGLSFWFNQPEGERADTLCLNKLIRMFNQVPFWHQNGDPTSRWALQYTSKFLTQKKFDTWQERFLLAFNQHELKQFDLAWKTLSPASVLLKSAPFRTADLWVQFLWLKGSCMKGIGNSIEAKYSFEKALFLESKASPEAIYALVLSCLGLAELANDRHDIPETKKWLTKVRDYSGYDWEQKIHTKLRILEDLVSIKEATLKFNETVTPTIQLFQIDEAKSVTAENPAIEFLRPN